MAAHQNHSQHHVLNGNYGVNGVKDNSINGGNVSHGVSDDHGINIVNGTHGINGGNDVNGDDGACHVNGDDCANGGDDSMQLQPSSSGSEEPVPSPRALCVRGLALSHLLVQRLMAAFTSQPLSQHAMAAVHAAVARAGNFATWINEAVFESHPVIWYVQMPLSLFKMISDTGVELAEKYLDNQLPQSRNLIDWLNTVREKVAQLQEAASTVTCSVRLPAVEPSPSPSSSVSSSSDRKRPFYEEELMQPETPGEKSMYFSIEKLTELEEEAEAGVDNEQETEETAEEPSEAQNGKAEEERSEFAAEATGEEAMTAEQPQPQPEPEPEQPQPPVAERLSSAEEAERAAMDVVPQPSDPPVSSEDFVAAEGSTRQKSLVSRRESKAKSKRKMLFGLF